jgi:hypothetical protein
VDVIHSIRHIQIPKESEDLFVTATYKDKVSLWSYSKKEKISEIDTILDFGGSRLALLPTNDHLIITGAYERFGAVAYNYFAGEIVWQRKDLKRIQTVTYLTINNEVVVGIGFDERPFTLLNIKDGSTINSYRGIRNIYSNDENTLFILQSNNRIQLSDLDTGNVYWRKDISPLFTCLTKNSLLSNTGYKLEEYDLNGDSKWHYNCPDNHIIHNIIWNQRKRSWLFILWNNIKGGPKFLGSINEFGALESINSLGEIWQYEFFRNGELIITSDGEILSTTDLSVMWKFCEREI